MNIKIVKVWTNPELSDTTEVITQVKAIFTGDHQSYELTQALDCDDLNNLSLYENITEEQIGAWLTSQLLPEHLSYIEELVDTPPVEISTDKVLPWELPSANTA